MFTYESQIVLLAFLLRIICVVSGICPDMCKCSLDGTIVDCVSVGLTKFPEPKSMPPQMHTLKINNNQISDICPPLRNYMMVLSPFYSGFKYLYAGYNSATKACLLHLPAKTVDLRFNRLSHLNPTSMASGGAAIMQTLDLSDNSFDRVSAAMFSGLKSLEKINLANNKIRSIESNTFQDQKNLTFINLASNSLTYLNASWFEGPVKSKLLIELSGNQFFCDCEILQVFTDMMEKGFRFANFTTPGQYMCLNLLVPKRTYISIPEFLKTCGGGFFKFKEWSLWKIVAIAVCGAVFIVLLCICCSCMSCCKCSRWECSCNHCKCLLDCRPCGHKKGYEEFD